MGKTLSPDQDARWVLSNNICNLVSLLMYIMFDNADEEDDDKESNTRNME